MRLSAHRLPIETGRYENIQRNERTCPLCSAGKGDEHHYLFQCLHPDMTSARAPLKHIAPSIINTDERCIAILNVEDPEDVHIVGKVCRDIFKVFSGFVTPTPAPTAYEG